MATTRGNTTRSTQYQIRASSPGALPISRNARLRVRIQPTNTASRILTTGISKPLAMISSHRNTVPPNSTRSDQMLKENIEPRPANQVNEPMMKTLQPRGAPVHSRNQPTTGSSKASEVVQATSTTNRNNAAVTNWLTGSSARLTGRARNNRAKPCSPDAGAWGNTRAYNTRPAVTAIRVSIRTTATTDRLSGAIAGI